MSDYDFVNLLFLIIVVPINELVTLFLIFCSFIITLFNLTFYQ